MEHVQNCKVNRPPPLELLYRASNSDRDRTNPSSSVMAYGPPSRSTGHSHSELPNRPKGELSEAELADLEAFEFDNGPLSVLTNAVLNQDQVLISLRNNRRLLARIAKFDRHSNMVLINVKEKWTETRRSPTRKKSKPINKDRFISKMFLRGDNVVLVLRHSG